MTTLPGRMAQQHVFVTVRDKQWPWGRRQFLVDTGAPYSIGRQSLLAINGRRYPLLRDYAGSVTLESLGQYIGCTFDGVLGTDILNEYDVVFDLGERRVTLHTDQVAMTGVTLPLTYLSGVPIVEAAVEGRAMRLFFDTGAFVTYVRHGIGIERHEPVRAAEDFYPTLWRFTVQTYRVPVTLGGCVYQLESGVMPEALARLILAHDVEGILGNEMLRGGRQVGYFPRRGVVVFSA
jgi:hypothetical protein